MIERSAVYHTSSFTYAYAVGSDRLRVRLRARAGDLTAVRVYYKNLYDHSDTISDKEMTRILCDGINDYFEAEICVPEKRFKYYFDLQSLDGERICYTADGFMVRPEEGNYFFLPYINPDDILALPAWAEGVTIYQVLIDRFRDGDHANNPPGVKPLTELPDRSTYYGGDFAGLIEELDYLSALGIGALYLSPLFKSPTYHKYDVSDYYAIEEIYGGEAELKKLVEAAHGKGIKIILDCVYNHCSSLNPLFLDVIEKGEASRYKDWFCIESFPVSVEKGNYDSFGGLVPSMPRFQSENDEVIDYLTGAAIYWTERLGIDGWRLDVADEVSHALWKVFRRRLKQLDPDILIIGEIWNHAAQWLQGDETDTCTNYKFRNAVIALAKGETDAEEFWRRTAANLSLYKSPLYGYLVNLVGSHDTVRLATLLGGGENVYPALAAMLTMQGMPLIYYGDEAGMEGGEDPDNRRAMQWELASGAFAEKVRRLSAFRAGSDILKKGNMTPLIAENPRLLSFVRSYGGKRLTAFINFGEAPAELPLPSVRQAVGEAVDINGKTLLPGKGCAVFGE